jgi:hypothetical protein
MCSTLSIAARVTVRPGRLRNAQTRTMGHHYVPQHYLRGFTSDENSGLVWMFDKKSRDFKRVPIKVAAQGPDFYEADTERALNQLVEVPAQPALVKLQRQQAISNDERLAVAIYIATMMMRVPRRRRKAHELIPSVLTDTVQVLRNKLRALAQQEGVNQELVAARLADLDKVEAKLLKEPPTDVLQRIRSPWPTQRMLAAILGMVWRVGRIPSGTSLRFLTGDNPAYFFESLGVGTPNSELTFPLDSQFVLFGCWKGPRGGLLWFEAPPQLIKEANRRLAVGAERFIFYHEPAKWISVLAGKTEPQLSRIAW